MACLAASETLPRPALSWAVKAIHPRSIVPDTFSSLIPLARATASPSVIIPNAIRRATRFRTTGPKWVPLSVPSVDTVQLMISLLHREPSKLVRSTGPMDE